MGIYINEQEKFFSLKTNNTEYQMQADEYGVLKHIWYGERVENNMSYLLRMHHAFISPGSPCFS